MSKTAKGTKWVRIPEYKRAGGIVRSHCRSTPNKKRK